MYGDAARLPPVKNAVSLGQQRRYVPIVKGRGSESSKLREVIVGGDMQVGMLFSIAECVNGGN